jgi:membrane fusion protein, heavy metal efflux system
MATKTRLSTTARAMQRPGLVALLVLTPALGGGVTAATDQPPAGVSRTADGAAAMRLLAQAPGGAGSGAAAASASVPPGQGAAGSTGGSRSMRSTSVACLIGPERTADIGSAVTGVVAAIRVERGDNVRRGQPLVMLEQEIERAHVQTATVRSAIEAELRVAEANLALARDRFERMNGLAGSGAVPALAIEQARSELEVAEQRVEQTRGQRKIYQQELGVAQAQLQQRTLKAPFDGVVVERLAHEGERVEDRPLLRLAQLDPLRVELVMPAARWGGVKKGETMALVPDLPQAARLLARVTHIDRTLDAASNTFRVRLSLPNPGHAVPAGARCKLESGAEAPGTVAPQPNATPNASGQISRAPASSGPLLMPLPAAALGRVYPATWLEPGRPMTVAPIQASRPRLRLTT